MTSIPRFETFNRYIKFVSDTFDKGHGAKKFQLHRKSHIDLHMEVDSPNTQALRIDTRDKENDVTAPHM